MRSFGTRVRSTALAGVLAIAAGVTVGSVATSADAAVSGCSVSYALTTQWNTGFTASVTITNLGDPLTAWDLGWSYAAGQQVTSGWNATISQSGAQVTARNQTWNGGVATGATVNFGFNGSWSGTNPAPTSFTLNGALCTGSVSPTTSPPMTAPPGASLPRSFTWHSSAVLIGPKSDATHNIRAVKDPSVVYHNGRWHVFATTTNQSGSYSMVYLSFTDWAQAAAAQHHYLDTTAIGTGYKAAPHVFYFAPQGRWYLVYQTGDNAAFSTTTDISNPQSWSAPQRFYAGGMPQIVRDNIGSGYWVDFWVICDSSKCYLFSSDDNGHLYRSETTVASFPNGMTNTVIAMQDAARYPLWEAANVYQVSGSTDFLLIVEAIGTGGTRYFRSWTAPAIAGPWTALADTQANPFAGATNVTFDGTAWSRDISHGEMLRSGTDQTMAVSPCHIRYLYQGKDPSATDSYSLLPWRLGLLTQTNSTC